MSSTIATGSTWWARASSISGRRASGCTLVASTTVSRPSLSRRAATSCSAPNASAVTAWSFSSSLTRPRKKSEDSTSVGRK
jgi:hypothetical protein